MPAAPKRESNRGRRKKILLDLLRKARVKAGLRQVDLAKRLGLPQSFVSKYESGERRLDLLDLEDVCAAIGLSGSEFVRRFEEECADTAPGGEKAET